MIRRCVDPRGLEHWLEYGWEYELEPMALGAVRVLLDDGSSIVCSGSRFSVFE